MNWKKGALMCLMLAGAAAYGQDQSQADKKQEKAEQQISEKEYLKQLEKEDRARMKEQKRTMKQHKAELKEQQKRYKEERKAYKEERDRYKATKKERKAKRADKDTVQDGSF